MDDEGHTVAVCSAEDTPELDEVRRVFKGDVGVAEVKLEAGAEVWVLDAARDLLKGVAFERVDTAETD